ncbi:MAG: Arginine decarboxylase [Firmicutes bacterium ADurb.Bin193]|nr:MAG: Arginine decarboxylase [Firmicutes bacterium ADurb.Bin193]
MIIKKGIDKIINKNTARFFMPGHNGDKSIPLRYDITEIKEADNLRCPSGMIRLAQKNASLAFGSLHTFFLVNGSSSGLFALIMSLCKRGDTLIIDRGCHISVLNTLVFHDIRPVFIYPAHNGGFGINSAVAPEDVERAFSENPEAKGVLITSPTYYGVCSDIRRIAEITHKNGGALIVDEAHGAHFAFSDMLPQSALMLGADGVVNSAHKTLPCITQGAFLHLGTSRIDPNTALENINLLMTTSPSYLIMMSLDRAATEMQKSGRARLEKVIKKCIDLKKAVNETGRYKCLENEDITRLVVHAGYNTASVFDELDMRYNIKAEMCDGLNLVFIAKAMTKARDLARLKSALLSIAKRLPALKEGNYPPPPKTVLKMPPSLAYYGKTKTVPPTEAVGQVAARAVYKTPPCMGIISPGEVITEEIARLLTEDVTIAVP